MSRIFHWKKKYWVLVGGALFLIIVGLLLAMFFGQSEHDTKYRYDFVPDAVPEIRLVV